ncbi:hypothetical protein K502DRAFT_365435 [Neoconidiobolus thromboides FSU 785]|nr:hypothetical protein K502DRAFT_365435 [Neoconidiobolus thromboides FSU 785]
MRVVIKGGVWKNTEDEILKAAVMKYGKNQWARISSLLVRKTPKQCKARWYEWLDPSIKKTEWSKEEDEKLLHLAKLMPTQWRTIAPIVGRTPAQCLERYQKLLDEAESSTAGLELTSGSVEAAPSADDVRRLRPGEIDPDPETKPARPDPVDMDEDEKEMLSEARARLANTQGKKAKRKAREKQLEEAKRVADMQKRREMKAAGIDIGFRKKKKGMDYNADIPFERKPIEGVYDTSEELSKKAADPNFKALKLQDIEPKKRHEIESEQQKNYLKKQKELKEKKGGLAENTNLDKMLNKEFSVNRTKLVLPKPQIGDEELEQIVKMGLDNQSASFLNDNQDSVAQGLVTDYSQTQLSMTPMRTPRTPAMVDTVRQEALNQLAMTRMQTPLLGEDVANNYNEEQGTGFEGATPRQAPVQTPNPLLIQNTPANQQTPAFKTPGTSLRDNFGINVAENDYIVSETPKIDQLRQLQLKEKIAQGFINLPKPKNDFVIVVPEEDEIDNEEIEVEQEVKEDAAEVERRIKAELEEEERILLKQRSQSLKLGLPRPLFFNSSEYLENAKKHSSFDSETQKELLLADIMIQEETVRLLQYESVIYPDKNGKAVKFDLSSYDEFDEDLLIEARELIEEELQNRQLVDYFDEDEESDDLDQIQGQYYKNRERISKLGGKVQKHEKKLGVLLGGYMARAQNLRKSIQDYFEQVEEASIEFESVSKLYQQEKIASKLRYEKLEHEVQQLKKEEGYSQEKYAELSQVKQQLMAELYPGM